MGRYRDGIWRTRLEIVSRTFSYRRKPYAATKHIRTHWIHVLWKKMKKPQNLSFAITLKKWIPVCVVNVFEILFIIRRHVVLTHYQGIIVSTSLLELFEPTPGPSEHLSGPSFTSPKVSEAGLEQLRLFAFERICTNDCEKKAMSH